MYDTIIIGGGPAGVAAGVYAARKKMKTMLVAETIGGQSSVSATIENWIGSVSIKGYEFGQSLEQHLRAQEGIEIRTAERVTAIEKRDDGTFYLTFGRSEAVEAKSVIIATGSAHRHLNVPGEEAFIGKGVAYCSTCDAPFFRNKTVAVVGAGNSGLEACQDLYAYANKIYLLSNSDKLGGDQVIQEEIKSNTKVEIVYNADTKEIVGENVVKALRYIDSISGEEKEIALDGVFVEIGMVPNSSLVKDLVELTPYGEIKVDHRTCATSRAGIFAAGDVADVAYRQNNIAAGQGCIAALSAEGYVKALSR